MIVYRLSANPSVGASVHLVSSKHEVPGSSVCYFLPCMTGGIDVRVTGIGNYLLVIDGPQKSRLKSPK